MLRVLHVTDWLCFAGDHTLHLDAPLAILTGANGAGKSALRDAIEFLIRGLCRGVERKKDLAAVVIHDRAKKATVIGQLGTLSIERSITRGGTQTLRVSEWVDGQARDLPGTFEQLQATLFERLGLDDGKARAALESWAFLSLDDDARKALLFCAIGGQADAAAIAARLIRRGFSGPDVDWLAKIATEQGFRKAEGAAIEQRRVIGRDLEALPVPQPGVRNVKVDGEEFDLDQVDVAKLEGQIGARRRELDEALRSTGESVGRLRGILETQRAREVEVEKVASGDVPEDGALRLSLTMADQRATECERAIESIDARLADLERKPEGLDQIDARLAELRATVAIAEQGIQHPGVCPKITGQFLCPATNDSLAVHARRIKKAATTAGAEIEKLEGERVEIVTRRDFSTAQAQAERAEILARKKAAESEVQKITADLRALQESGVARDRARGDLERLRKEIEQNAAAIASAEADPGRADFLRQRIARGEALLAPARAWQAAKRDQAAARREELLAARERADGLAKALAPDGVEADLVREALAPIRERLAVTSPMLGAISIADDLSIAVQVDGNPRSERQLSQSQRLRVAIALQDAIAATTAFPILLVDELDTLAGDAKAAALRVLDGLREHYANVIVFQTLQRGEVPRRLAPHVQTFHVVHGTVEAIV